MQVNVKQVKKMSTKAMAITATPMTACAKVTINKISTPATRRIRAIGIMIRSNRFGNAESVRQLAIYYVGRTLTSRVRRDMRSASKSRATTRDKIPQSSCPHERKHIAFVCSFVRIRGLRTGTMGRRQHHGALTSYPYAFFSFNRYLQL